MTRSSSERQTTCAILIGHSSSRSSTTFGRVARSSGATARTRVPRLACPSKFCLIPSSAPQPRHTSSVTFPFELCFTGVPIDAVGHTVAALHIFPPDSLLCQRRFTHRGNILGHPVLADDRGRVIYLSSLFDRMVLFPKSCLTL